VVIPCHCWEELEEKGRGPELEFRVVMQQGAVRPGLMTL